jgi:peptidyl-dipeptidase A
MLLLLSLSFACAGGKPPEATPEAEPAAPGPEEAAQFALKVDDRLKELWIDSAKAQWAYATDITDEHAAVVQTKEEASMAYSSSLVREAKAFDGIEGTDPGVARQIMLMQRGGPAPAPDDAAKRKELAALLTDLEGTYGKGEYCVDGDCRDLGQLEAALAEGSRNGDWDAQLDAWQGWRTISPPLRPKYTRFVELVNEGAEELGYADLSEAWRGGYDMSPADFDAEVERLWQQVKPLYEQLHCHVRAELAEKYGADKVPVDGPIPAHLLGNMWSQSWENLYPLLTPYPGEPSLDVTAALQEKGYDHTKMVKTAESFFTSLGLKPLPDTFWERSMFLKPDDREVVCHASAWDVEMNGDARIKMCIKIDHEDFVTIHHELGHNYYYLYYHDKPALFQNGAHDGFHEGIGDTLALSITPGYLKEIGLLDTISETEQGVINKQLQDALAKIAFLPFGRMIDKWRWGVFAGEIAPDDYNAAWWKLREEYQGIASPLPRDESHFDPGAKYHIPANTPYMRYFLAHVLQFQFHEALCKASGHTGPLHTCSIYGSEPAGDRMAKMLAMGSSQPWPDALEALTGSREQDAGALVRYFEPLTAWLAEQNEGRTCGW